MSEIEEIRKIVEHSKVTADPISFSASTLDGLATYHARMLNTVALNVAKVTLAEIDRLQDELEKSELNANDWQDEYESLKRRYDELDKSGQETMELLQITSKQLQSAQKEIERLKTQSTSDFYVIQNLRGLQEQGEKREQKLIEGLQQTYAYIEGVEDYANVKYARDELLRFFNELGVTE